MTYRIGLDIGIGSVGWAVISGSKEEAKIEDFGVRIFDSGESNGGKDRKSQDRRHHRGSRRLIRRREYRRMILKNHLLQIGLLDKRFEEKYDEIRNSNVYELKVKGLDEKLTPEELYKCIIHFCNHRGYKDFYEDSDEQDDESGKNKEAVRTFDKLFEESGYRTVSEYVLNEKKGPAGVEFRNRDSRKGTEYLLIHRFLLKDELSLIIKKQQEFYDCLKGQNGEFIVDAVFRQRIFEEGPGNPENPYRRYTGFLETLGQCPFYKEEKRGFRATVISDVYGVVNTFSQYRYKNLESGELEISKELACGLIDFFMKNGSISVAEAKKIAKAHGYEMMISSNSDTGSLQKAQKYIKPMKKIVEEAGENWEDLIDENQFDLKKMSLLNRIGETLSKYQTPSKRKEELKKLGISDEFMKALSVKKFGGTSAASYRYMVEAIDAFKNGEVYGNFQAGFLKSQKEETENPKSIKLLPKHIDDEDVKDNPVVFRSINETRKVLNAIIEVYGSPEYINVEVASDLNRSFEERKRIQKEQRDREKARDKTRQNIAELINISVEEVTERQIDIFSLYAEQEGKSLYSQMPLGDLKDILEDKSHVYEVDHIVPYSLILDNTLNNKALVYASENQMKGQKTPLMYLSGEEGKSFLAFVNALYLKKNGISKRKYGYLTLKTLYGNEAEEILRAWKSRNINDTRYITKYIVAMLNTHLLFNGNHKQHVYGVKGAFTSKFRRVWLKGSIWGEEEKNRESYLNHAVDAIIVANLTPAYLEIASDNIKLNQIFRRGRKTKTAAYYNYLESCLVKMEKYYGFSRSYTQKLLESHNGVPAYLSDVKGEIETRITDNEDELVKRVREFYGSDVSFVAPPHVPIASIKPSRRFRGTIADDKPIRIADIDGEKYKIVRKEIKQITKKDLDKLYTTDHDLVSTLRRILNDTKDGFSIGEYMEENQISVFLTDKGTKVYKVSVREANKVTNFYKKNIDDNNYTNMSMLKYYCVEVYKNKKGETKTWGIRYVDIIKRDKKLYLKKAMLPEDYAEHCMYLFTNDAITVYNKSGEKKYEGFYKSVKSINRSSFYIGDYIKDEAKPEQINRTDTVKKLDVSILGIRGGGIACSVPLSLTPER